MQGDHAMWVLFGTVAIITAVINIALSIMRREAKWFRFISLSCTALTLCAFYSQANHWATTGDASAMLDVMPTLSKILWFLTIGSILANGISLFPKKAR